MNLKMKMKMLVSYWTDRKKKIPAAQMMLIVVWAAVRSVSVSIVIDSNSNSPYQQWLSGVVVMLGCAGGPLMLLVMGVVSASGTTFPFGCANMTKWSMHTWRVYKPVLFIILGIIISYYITLYNRYGVHVNKLVATDCNWFSSVLYKCWIAKTTTDYLWDLDW